MIPVTRMAVGKGTVSTRIKGLRGRRPSSFADILRPVVFWNITRACNLKCIHCYISAGPHPLPGELSTEEALEVARQLVEHGVPLVTLSGGEPLVRRDFWAIAEALSGHDTPKLALSSNGTLITRETAARLRRLGFSYVGISLDSVDPGVHDKFRGAPGAFKAAIRGARNALEEGLDVGFRLTITKYNLDDAPRIIRLASDMGVPRVAIYVVDLLGRATPDLAPSPEDLRRAIDAILEESVRHQDRVEVLLVRANFAGVYLADRLAKTREEFLQLLSLVGSHGDCGRKSVSIYPDGTVRPCQFLEEVVIGDLKRQRLGEILSADNPLLKPFIAVDTMLRGPKCGGCPFKRVCGGGSRMRALKTTGEFWGDDPLCFIDPWSIARRWGYSAG
ncbi:radical SAM/SPASM domain-containing protein [Aeropyrum pernix]|uniref:radical SAM/SPASM domain-containing protein n=1 Tax=Aeropyrum pernix TaxID=56636 RepID=UPI001037B0BD|nr:radical SAM protein [Aeropyrum pernix]